MRRGRKQLHLANGDDKSQKKISEYFAPTSITGVNKEPVKHNERSKNARAEFSCRKAIRTSVDSQNVITIEDSDEELQVAPVFNGTSVCIHQEETISSVHSESEVPVSWSPCLPGNSSYSALTVRSNSMNREDFSLAKEVRTPAQIEEMSGAIDYVENDCVIDADHTDSSSFGHEADSSISMQETQIIESPDYLPVGTVEFKSVEVISGITIPTQNDYNCDSRLKPKKEISEEVRRRFENYKTPSWIFESSSETTDDDEFGPQVSRNWSALNVTPSKRPKTKPSSKSPKTSRAAAKGFRALKRNRSFSGPAQTSSVKVARTEDSPDKTGRSHSHQPSGPYYLRNFMTVVQAVMDDNHNNGLISSDEKKFYDKFIALSFSAKCLYLRLFQRKWEFKVASNIKYERIASDLTPLFFELYSNYFLEKLHETSLELKDLLNLLTLDQISTLAKNMKLKGNRKTKEALIKVLLQTAKDQKTISGNRLEILQKQSVQIIGEAYRLNEGVKKFFMRLFILYSPPQYWDSENGQCTNNLLTEIFLNERGNLQYPKYTLSEKHTHIYRSREDFLRFENAWILLKDLNQFIADKEWEFVQQKCEKAVSEFKNILSIDAVTNHDIQNPEFLRVYSAGSVLAYTIWHGIDGFQKLKMYKRANEIIENVLLQQSIYCSNYRGKWHERLGTNAKHLRTPLEVIEHQLFKALSDPEVRNSNKLYLSEKIERLRQERKNRSRRRKKRSVKTNEEEKENPDNLLFKLKSSLNERTITGEKMMTKEVSGGKSVFLSSKNRDGARNISSVESHAMDFYLNEGFHGALHGEGSIPATIYGLLFWDIIYSQIDDVFYSPYQAYPLDFCHKEFYTNRKTEIDKRLKDLRRWSLKKTVDIASKTYESNCGAVSCVNWTLTLEEISNLITSMGVRVVAGLCDKMAKDFRHSRGGFPDLVVWNRKKCRFVEVKGPGDQLSPKQKLWLEYLVEIGAEAEVCYVKSVSSKRISLPEADSSDSEG